MSLHCYLRGIQPCPVNKAGEGRWWIIYHHFCECMPLSQQSYTSSLLSYSREVSADVSYCFPGPRIPSNYHCTEDLWEINIRRGFFERQVQGDLKYCNMELTVPILFFSFIADDLELLSSEPGPRLRSKDFTRKSFCGNHFLKLFCAVMYFPL